MTLLGTKLDHTKKRAETSSTHRNASLTIRRKEDQEDHIRPLEMGLIRRLWGYSKPYSGRCRWLLVLVVLRSIQLPALTYLVAAIIKGPVAEHNVQGVIAGSIAFLVLALSTQLVMHFRQRFALELGERIVLDLRNELFAHLQLLPMSFFQRTKVGRIISRLSSDVENVRIGVQDVLFVGVVQVGQMLVAALCMLWSDSMLFLLVLGMVPILYGINRIFHRHLSQSLRDVQESFSRVTATLAESVNGIRVTQSFVRQDRNAQLFSDLLVDHSTYNMQVTRTQGVFIPLLDLNSQFFIAALLFLGGLQVFRFHSTELGDLVTFFFMANMFFSPITVAGNLYNQALTAMAGAERIFRLLDQTPEWSDAPDAIDPGTLEGRVEFRDVSFAYDADRLVLRNIHFTAKPGSSIALVGETGSGKTTIINLVAKFYLPTSGSVLMDGRDSRSYRTHALRRQIGVVLQQNFLFSTSVLENIRLGRPTASDAEIREVLDRLDCLDLFESLPKGLETEVGERGGSLSLGQRQLVCFARAMLTDPRILILDEATSSVDPITEAKIQRALYVLLKGRTSFVIAHRLSTIRRADCVYVLDHGQIVESGTHDELLANGGAYAELHQAFVRH